VGAHVGRGPDLGSWSWRRRRRFAFRFVPTLTGILVIASIALESFVQAGPLAPLAQGSRSLVEIEPPPAETTNQVVPLQIDFPEPEVRLTPNPIKWRRSQAVGLPYGGNLVDGVQLPKEGSHFVVDDAYGHRAHTTWSSDRMVRFVLRITSIWHRNHPDRPRLVIGDLSLERGGPIGGHASHQNGRDVDIFWPRRDRQEIRPDGPEDVDIGAAQDLVDIAVAAGAEFVFVGPSLGLTGPGGIVQDLWNHDDHAHVRIPGW